MAEAIESVRPDEIGPTIDRLMSPRDGERAITDALFFGPRIIPALRDHLLIREPSGSHESRRRAVTALALLGANDALLEYLNSASDVADPVERADEDTIITAAAEALAESKDARVYPLLLEIAGRRPTAGIIRALGMFRRLEALVILVAALFKEPTRRTAEEALRKLGPTASPALFDALLRAGPVDEPESKARLRGRRSAIGLLAKLSPELDETKLSPLRLLVEDADPRISVSACDLCLRSSHDQDRLAAARRLIELLPSADWLLHADIEELLVQHYLTIRSLIDEALQRGRAQPEASTERQTALMLMRVKARAERFTPKPRHMRRH